MTDISTENTDTTKPRLRAGRTIALGDDKLVPRRQLAEEVGVTDQTLQRMKLATVYIARVAHVRRDASLKEIGERGTKPRREPQPKKKARGP